MLPSERKLGRMTKDLHDMNAEELHQYMVLKVFEANMVIRALDLLGYAVDADVVGRPADAAHPHGYPELVVRVRERG